MTFIWNVVVGVVVVVVDAENAVDIFDGELLRLLSSYNVIAPLKIGTLEERRRRRRI